MAGISLRIVPLLVEVERDIRRVQRQVIPRAEANALNSTNRTIRTQIVRESKALLNLKNQKALRRQIRIPRSFRARPDRLRAGGLFDVVVPASTGTPGQRLTLKKGKEDRSIRHEPFDAKMKSGKRGLFVRAPKSDPGHKRPWRGEGDRRYRTELPIWEVLVDATPIVGAKVRQILAGSGVIYKRRFEQQFKRLMARARA